MNYLEDLNEKEIEYICSQISFKETADYFRRYPKEFAKLRPGFRVKALKENDVRKTLLDFRNRDFISTFIVGHIERWISEISDELKEVSFLGFGEEETYINVLSRSVFAANIRLYFKITEEEKTEEYLSLLSAAVNQVVIIEREKCCVENQLEKKISEKLDRITSLDKTISDMNNNEKALNRKLEEEQRKTKKINDQISNLNDEHKETIRKLNEKISNYESENKKLKKYNSKCEELQQKVNSLEEKLKEESDNQIIKNEEEKEYTDYVSIVSQTVRPIDMDDFDEYLNYNLCNIGLNDGKELLYFIHHIKRIAFNGVPLLLKHSPGINLANCLSNTIYGQKSVNILSYKEGVCLKMVEEYIKHSTDRVICIDGFVGNCNMIELITLLSQFRDKIIILTYMFDKTLSYLPMEVFAYVNYVNVDEFSSLLNIKTITEDPSMIKEETFSIENESTKGIKYKSIFREISNECGFSPDVANALVDYIEDQDSLNCYLLFSVLPYVSKVMLKNPFNCSSRLQRYAGDSGKCACKDIIKEWFG